MNDSIKKSEEKQEGKKFYRQIDAKELLSNHPEFVLIPELENEEWVFACPISWKGAKFADSTECGGTGAKWCIGYEKDSYYWKQYTDEGFSFIFALRKDFKTHSRKNDIKYMIQILPNKGFNVWNQIDKNIIKNNKDKLESLFDVESDTLITIGKEYFDSNLRDGFGYEINGDTLIVTDNDFVAPKRKQFSRVIISDGVTSIGEYVFEDCNNIMSVTIPNSVTKIGRGAFYCCRGLTSVIIPDSVTIIDDATFLYCSGLTSVVIPDSVKSIGNHAFDDCSRLTSVIIPDGVVSIGDGAFIDCSSLTSVTIGNDITSIGDYAFKDCSNLTTLTIKAQVPPQLSSDTFKECHSLESIFVPKESVEDYKSANGWKKYSSIIKGI